MNQENREFKKRIIAIALPIILSNLVSQVEMLVDRMFLGHLDIACMSAVSNASSPLYTTENVIFTLSVGSTILISQMIGTGNKEKAKEYTRALFKCSNILSIVMFALWLLFPQLVFKIMGDRFRDCRYEYYIFSLFFTYFFNCWSFEFCCMCFTS